MRFKVKVDVEVIAENYTEAILKVEEDMKHTHFTYIQNASVDTLGGR